MVSAEVRKKQYGTLEDNYICVSDMLHGLRVAKLALKICDVLQIEEDLKHDIFIAGVFHDIGKAVIDNSILNKPGKLTTKEKNRVNLHSLLGAQIAFDAGFSEECVQIINYHHENYDGTGYPLGKSNENIPIGARIIKVCDVYDALTSDRPYRKAKTSGEALREMEKELDTYDSLVYVALMEVLLSENKPQND